jgi:hypothetical protein
MTRARDLANIGPSVDAGGITGRNLIINGAMQVAQRGNSTSITSGGAYFSPDRFEVGITATDQLAATLSQSTIAPDGFSNSVKFEVTTAETTLDADELVTIRQKVEGQNLQSIAKGTSSAKQVTASFWVRSSNTGTYILELYDLDNTRQVSKSYTINSANTWEYKTITFPADTTGAFDNDNNLSLFFMFWLAAGSNFTSGTLNTSWASETTANRVVGQTNLIASTNDFYITGVQLELGSSATPFEHRSYGDELARCQRYYYQIKSPSAYTRYAMSTYDTSTDYSAVIPFPIEMRSTPTMSTTGTASNYSIYALNSNKTSNAVPSITAGSPFNVCVQGATSSSTGGAAGVLLDNNTAGTFLGFSAEL